MAATVPADARGDRSLLLDDARAKLGSDTFELDYMIDGDGARVELAKVGLPLTAFVRLRCTLGKCLLKTARVDEFPEVREVHKLSSRYCTLLKVAAASTGHLEELIDRLGKHGEMETEVVLSSP